jgi:hypothetical protein
MCRFEDQEEIFKHFQSRLFDVTSCMWRYLPSSLLVGWFIVFNATLYNISVISWGLVLLVEETGVPGANHWQTLSHNAVSSTLPHEWDSNSQFYWLLALIAHEVVNPTTIRSRIHILGHFLYVMLYIFQFVYNIKHIMSMTVWGLRIKY